MLKGSEQKSNSAMQQRLFMAVYEEGTGAVVTPLQTLEV